jgi:hypothetical protein
MEAPLSDRLLKLASDFRAAIERCPREGLPITFERFPHGSCGDAALLLAKYLERNAHTGFVYVLGMRDQRSHAWLQRDDLVIDITADQFEDQDQPVIVARVSTWHSTFTVEPEDQHHADFTLYDAATAATLAQAYHAIVENI